MLAAYLESANNINGMSALDFFSRYGEASRVLSAVGGDPNEAARKVFDLYKRHAAQVTGVVDQAIISHAAAIRTRELPATCLLRLMCDSASVAAGDGSVEPREPAAPPGPPELPDYVFRRVGQVWQVRFAGGAVNLLLPTKGAAYLHSLLSRPHAVMRARDLAFSVAWAPANYALGDAGARTDGEALTAYRVRYEELGQELTRARADNDAAALDRIESERAVLGAEIRRALGPRGRIRREANDLERIRKAVGNAIRRTIRDIAVFDQPLAEHFRSHRLSCGAELCYMPEASIEWET